MKSIPEKESGAIMLEMVMKIALVAMIALAGVRALGFSVADSYCVTAGYLAQSGMELNVLEDWELDRSRSDPNRPCVKVDKRGGEP